MSYFDAPVEADASKAQTVFKPLPEGMYELLIEKSEEGLSKAQNPMLKLTMIAADSAGEYAGRKLFANINLGHSNPEVVQIGTRQLHALMLMSGLKIIKDATDLTGRTIKAKVTVKKREDTGELTNEVRFAHRPDEQAPTQTPAPANSTAPKAASASKDW